MGHFLSEIEFTVKKNNGYLGRAYRFESFCSGAHSLMSKIGIYR